jgi:L-seryl-tRNA(Ser) seleniumtransferase
MSPEAVESKVLVRLSFVEITAMKDFFSKLPSVNELLEMPPIKTLVDQANRSTVMQQTRQFLERMASDVQSAAASRGIPTPGEVAEQLARWLRSGPAGHARRVINATGALFPRGTSGPPLPPAAVQAIANAASGYTSHNSEAEPSAGSQIFRGVERLVKNLLGLESAIVTNSHETALLLALGSLPREEVVVSRAEVGELEPGVRLADLVAASGKRLREVGATNATRSEDYEAALSDRTSCILRVQTGRYHVMGGVDPVPLAELASLGRRGNVPVIVDAVAGAFVNVSRQVAGEPVVSDSAQQGVDLLLFSGGKLLGGPACGVIAGRGNLIATINAHPLAAAYAASPLILAGLEATLDLYRTPETVEQNIPLLTLLLAPDLNLKNRAERLAPQLTISPAIASAEVVADIGCLMEEAPPAAPYSGAQKLANWAVALTPARGGAESLAAALRRGEPAVLGRIKDNRLLIDLRSVFPAQDAEIALAVERLAGNETSEPKNPET